MIRESITVSYGDSEMSVDTYGAQECRVYYVAESRYGVTPTSPAMLGINTEGPELKKFIMLLLSY